MPAPVANGFCFVHGSVRQTLLVVGRFNYLGGSLGARLISSAFFISESHFRYADGGASDNQAVALPGVLAVGANKLGVVHGSWMFVGSDIRVAGLYLVEHIRLTSASTSARGSASCCGALL